MVDDLYKLADAGIVELAPAIWRAIGNEAMAQQMLDEESELQSSQEKAKEITPQLPRKSPRLEQKLNEEKAKAIAPQHTRKSPRLGS